MTAPVQPTLEGDIPPAKVSKTRRRIEDYEAWVLEVRPVFEEIARTGRRHFLCWQVKEERDLPDPPDPDHDWGRLVGFLRRENVIERDGFGETRDKSGVKAWRGTRTARRAAA